MGTRSGLCDVRSHELSDHTGRRPGRGCDPDQCPRICSQPWRAPRVIAAFEARGKAQGAAVPSGGRRQGKGRKGERV